MSVVSVSLKRLPFTTAIIYVLLGIFLGYTGLSPIALTSVKDASFIRLITEVVVIISLFTTGLKLRLPLSSPEWKTPFLLASSSMLITIFFTALTAHFLMRFSWGAAILLGAILAPTDPVLASSVQVLGPEDRDRLRFSLTAEAGLNDGTAFPFVMLGLGLLGLRDIGAGGWRWVLNDLLWGVIGGLGIGTILAAGVGKLISYIRTTQEETESLDDFLALGLISLSYGLAVLLQAYGFLAVFASGLGLRRRERYESQSLDAVSDLRESSPRTDTVSGHMAYAVLGFNEQMEHIGELVAVILLGVMLANQEFYARDLWLIPVLILIIRPLSVYIGTPFIHHGSHKRLLSWFGIRGIGSLYYLAFAIELGLPEDMAKRISALTLSTIIASIFIHGLSAAPLMIRHARRKAP